MTKKLYKAEGYYRFNGVSHPIPTTCQYFHSLPNKKRWTLKYLIAANLDFNPDVAARFIMIPNVEFIIVKGGHPVDPEGE